MCLYQDLAMLSNRDRRGRGRREGSLVQSHSEFHLGGEEHVQRSEQQTTLVFHPSDAFHGQTRARAVAVQVATLGDAGLLTQTSIERVDAVPILGRGASDAREEISRLARRRDRRRRPWRFAHTHRPFGGEQGQRRGRQCRFGRRTCGSVVLGILLLLCCGVLSNKIERMSPRDAVGDKLGGSNKHAICCCSVGSGVVCDSIRRVLWAVGDPKKRNRTPTVSPIITVAAYNRALADIYGGDG